MDEFGYNIIIVLFSDNNLDTNPITFKITPSN